MPVRTLFWDKGEWESVNTVEEERTTRLKIEAWDALFSVHGNIIRSELQPLNDRAGGQMENASPVYISAQKLGHVCEWLESNSHCCCLWCLHLCSTADRIDWKAVCVGIRDRETRKVRNWGRNKGPITSCTFLSLLFLNRQGQMSFFFIASLCFPLKTDHLIDSVALTHSFWRLLYANTQTNYQKRQRSWGERVFCSDLNLLCLIFKGLHKLKTIFLLNVTAWHLIHGNVFFIVQSFVFLHFNCNL